MIPVTTTYSHVTKRVYHLSALGLKKVLIEYIGEHGPKPPDGKVEWSIEIDDEKQECVTLTAQLTEPGDAE